MVVIVLENASEKLRGIITRWLLETKPGVFVGSLNAKVREKIWEKITEDVSQSALLIYSCNTEQGFRIEMVGEPTRSLVDLDGVQLIKRK